MPVSDVRKLCFPNSVTLVELRETIFSFEKIAITVYEFHSRACFTASYTLDSFK